MAKTDATLSVENVDKITDLMTSCQLEDEEKVRQLLTPPEESDAEEMGVTFEQFRQETLALLLATDSAGRTCLHYCVENRKPIVVDLLFERLVQLQRVTSAPTASVRSPEDVNQTPQNSYNLPEDIHLAAEPPEMLGAPTVETSNSHDLITQRHAPDSCKVLLETKDKRGLTALHHAVIVDNDTIAKSLLQHGANVTAADSEGHTVVHFATVHGRAEQVETLCLHGADFNAVDVNKASPLHYAAQLCNEVDDVAPDKDSSLGPRLAVVRRLLGYPGIMIDAFDADQRTPLVWAASNGSERACVELLTAGANCRTSDCDGLTPLHCAASRGHLSCVDLFLSTCDDIVDMTDHNGCTALFYAITLGHSDCSMSLLNHGANPNHVDAKGRSPAHCAALRGCVDTLKTLRLRRGNLWMTSLVAGNYPVHEAAVAGHTGAVRYLMGICRKTAVINLCNALGRSCLHVAAMTNNVELARWLIESKAHLNLVMREKGKELTAYDIAVLKSNDQCAELLRIFGGKTAAELQQRSGPGNAKENNTKRQSTTNSRKIAGSKPNTTVCLRTEFRQTVEAAAAAAALEAEYWKTDENELQEKAAEIVRQAMKDAMERLAREAAEREAAEKRLREERRLAKAKPKPVKRRALKTSDALVYDDHGASDVYGLSPALAASLLSPRINVDRCRGKARRRSDIGGNVARLAENWKAYGARCPSTDLRKQRSDQFQNSAVQGDRRRGIERVGPILSTSTSATAGDIIGNSRTLSFTRTSSAFEEEANDGAADFTIEMPATHVVEPRHVWTTCGAPETTDGGSLSASVSAVDRKRLSYSDGVKETSQTSKIEKKRKRNQGQGADVTHLGQNRNVIQQLVRAFEVKRLATFELHSARRHQIHRLGQASGGGSVLENRVKDHCTPSPRPGSESKSPSSVVAGGGCDADRSLVRRLANEFNALATSRIAASHRIDERKFRDVSDLQRHLCAEIQRASKEENVLKKMDKMTGWSNASLTAQIGSPLNDRRSRTNNVPVSYAVEGKLRLTRNGANGDLHLPHIDSNGSTVSRGVPSTPRAVNCVGSNNNAAETLPAI